MAYDLVRSPFWNLPFTQLDDDDFPSMPSMNSNLSISEDEKNVYVEAALPGINPSDVEVTFDKGVVWIKGEAKEEEDDKKRKFYRRATRSFSYRVTVPGDIDMSVEPKATAKHGVMTIAFAKSPQSQPRKIAVKNEEKE